MPPTMPASAAPPASAGPLALLAAEPMACPALCAPLATVSRVASTRSFIAPVVRLAAERFPPELRLLLEGFDARLDCDRLLRDVGREREVDEPDRVPERD